MSIIADIGADFAGLAGAGAAVVVAGIGGFFKILHNIGARFTDLSDKIDNKTTEIVNRVTQIYDVHERLDQQRHEETVQRLTRVETLVNGYNGSRRKRP